MIYEKIVTDIEKLYTHFEFDNSYQWEDFDKLLSVLVDQMGCEVIEKSDIIWFRYCELKKDKFVFRLLYDEDFGCNLSWRDKMDDAYYDQLEQIAKEVVEKWVD